MRLLAIATLPFRSGGGRAFQFGGSIFFEQLLPELAAAGHRVRVLAEAPPAAEGSGLPIDQPGLGVEWFALDYRSGATPPPPDFVARQERTLDELLRGEQPDVVLLGRETLAWYAPAACRRAGLPVVLVAKGSPSAGLAAGLYPDPARAAFGECMRQPDLVISVAHHLEQPLRELGVERILTIPNVVDSARFHPEPRSAALLAELDIDPGAPIVAHFAGLLPGKRSHDLIASAAAVLDAEPDAIYVVSGQGPGLERAKREAAARGLDHAFRWAGQIDRARMPDFLNLADVVLHVSEREGAPFTYLEAQACARPLLASDIPAAREAMDEGRTGLLYPLGDAGALADRTLALLRDPATRERLGRAARAEVQGKRLDEWAGAYARALAEVAASTASS